MILVTCHPNSFDENISNFPSWPPSSLPLGFFSGSPLQLAHRVLAPPVSVVPHSWALYGDALCCHCPPDVWGPDTGALCGRTGSLAEPPAAPKAFVSQQQRCLGDSRALQWECFPTGSSLAGSPPSLVRAQCVLRKHRQDLALCWVNVILLAPVQAPSLESVVSRASVAQSMDSALRPLHSSGAGLLCSKSKLQK